MAKIPELTTFTNDRNVEKAKQKVLTRSRDAKRAKRRAQKPHWMVGSKIVKVPHLGHIYGKLT